MADDRVGQVFRVDVGLWRLIRVVRLEVARVTSLFRPIASTVDTLFSSAKPLEELSMAVESVL